MQNNIIEEEPEDDLDTGAYGQLEFDQVSKIQQKGGGYRMAVTKKLDRIECDQEII